MNLPFNDLQPKKKGKLRAIVLKSFCHLVTLMDGCSSMYIHPNIISMSK